MPEPNVVLTAPVLDWTPQDVDSIVDEVQACHALFSPLFQRREQRAWVKTDLHGVLRDIPRKSVEPMALQLHGANRNAVRAVQQFVGEGARDDRPILAQLWRDVATDLGDADALLVVDGGDFPKQQTTSAKSALPGRAHVG